MADTPDKLNQQPATLTPVKIESEQPSKLGKKIDESELFISCLFACVSPPTLKYRRYCLHLIMPETNQYFVKHWFIPIHPLRAHVLPDTSY